MEEQRTEMWCNDGTSDKVYNMSLTEISDGKWQVKCTYGKRRNASSTAEYPEEPTDYYTASAEYKKLIKKKEKKGYQITFQR